MKAVSHRAKQILALFRSSYRSQTEKNVTDHAFRCKEMKIFRAIYERSRRFEATRALSQPVARLASPRSGPVMSARGKAGASVDPQPWKRFADLAAAAEIYPILQSEELYLRAHRSICPQTIRGRLLEKPRAAFGNAESRLGSPMAFYGDLSWRDLASTSSSRRSTGRSGARHPISRSGDDGVSIDRGRCGGKTR